jgi:hypothetical protein
VSSRRRAAAGVDRRGARDPAHLTGKRLEVPVKRVLMGAASEQAINRNSVADPTAFDALVGVASERLAHRATGARRPGA